MRLMDGRFSLSLLFCSRLVILSSLNGSICKFHNSIFPLLFLRLETRLPEVLRGISVLLVVVLVVQDVLGCVLIIRLFFPPSPPPYSFVLLTQGEPSPKEHVHENLYKTELCRTWEASHACQYGAGT